MNPYNHPWPPSQAEASAHRRQNHTLRFFYYLSWFLLLATSLLLADYYWPKKHSIEQVRGFHTAYTFDDQTYHCLYTQHRASWLEVREGSVPPDFDVETIREGEKVDVVLSGLYGIPQYFVLFDNTLLSGEKVQEEPYPVMTVVYNIHRIAVLFLVIGVLSLVYLILPNSVGRYFVGATSASLAMIVLFIIWIIGASG